MSESKRPRGFAAMSPERRKEIASMGGKAVPGGNRSFSRDRVLAAAAGAAGGQNVPSQRRSFAADRDLAAAAGRKGAKARAKKQGGDNNG